MAELTPDPAEIAAESLAAALAPVVGSRVVRLGTGQAVPTDGADVWVLRPDPNYRSALDLLDAVDRASHGAGVVVLHSVGWPTGTRDCYPAPDRLPPGAVHPYTTIDPALIPHGDDPGAVGRPEPGGVAWAIRDGGPENGVGTALDDHLAGRSGRSVRRLPVGSGLAVVWRGDDVSVAAIVDDRTTWCGDAVLAVIDAQRRALTVRIATLEQQLRDAGDAGPRLRDENARLRARVRRQTEVLDDIARSAEELSYSSVLRVVDSAERVARRRRPGASVRQRIAAIRDRAAGARGDG